jgi:uncharacterized Zn ribbon protein
LELQNRENEQLLSQLNHEKEQAELKLNHLHTLHREHISCMKTGEADNTIYIVSTQTYARQGIFKVGHTRKTMKRRSSGHNVTHVQGDRVVVLNEFKVHDSASVEKNIHTKLKSLAIKDETEFFMCPYDMLVGIVKFIVQNDTKEYKLVNNAIDKIGELSGSPLNSRAWMRSLDQTLFREQLTITYGSNSSEWTETQKKEFVRKCIKLYCQQTTKRGDTIEVEWKCFRNFLIQRLLIPEYKFKTGDWKTHIADEIDQSKTLSIKWRCNQ